MRQPVLHHALVLSAALAAGGSLAGQTLVEDINSAPPDGVVGSFPTGFTEAGGRAYFAAQDAYGLELWSTDGTAGGTARVKDIVPGPGSSSPKGFAALKGGGVVFAAAGEPWRSDGTEAGTFALGDLKPGPASSNPGSFVALGAQVFFLADDGTHGVELWRTNGTPEGTVLVADTVPGAAGVAGATGLCRSGGALYFGAQVAGAGHALVRSDGTAAGTAPVAVVTAAPFEALQMLTDVNGVLLFRAEHPQLGLELWRSDGTAAGTAVLADLAPGAADSTPKDLFPAGDRVFFSASHPAIGEELWVTDGHASGTFPVADVAPGAIFGSQPKPVGVVGTRYLFSAMTWNEGRELWATDGTTAGTHLVANIAPGSTSSSPSLGAALGGRVVFLAGDGTHGKEPWITDGTSAGTGMLADLTPDGVVSVTGGFATFGGAVLFAADDGVHGAEPHVTDGTAAGTSMLLDIGQGALTAPSHPKDLTRAGDRLYFTAEDAVEGRELWTSDGTPAGTRRVLSITPGPASTSFSGLSAVGDRLFFVADGPFGAEPHVTDGTAAGTQLLIDVFPGPASSNWTAPPRAALGGKLLFTAVDPVSFGSLFVTDGTPAGTKSLGAQPTLDMVALGDRVVMLADQAATGTEPYVTDDPDATPTLLMDIRPGTAGSVFSPFLAASDARAWFLADDGVHGHELWTTDGTAAGTRMVADLTKGGASKTVYHVAPLGDEAIVHVHDFVDGHQLLVTDASPEGVSQVAILGANDPVSGLFSAGDVVYFATGNTSGGWDHWRTDGTAAGTQRLAGDLLPVHPAVFATPGSGGRTAIGARRPDVGSELFVADGSADEPALVADVAPGALDAAPHDLVRVGGTVFFVADDAVHGEELHALPLAAFGDHAAEVFGVGFAPDGVPSPALDPTSPPVAGETFALEVTDLPPSAPVLLLVGVAPAHFALPDGALLHVAAPFVGLPATAGADGSLALSASVPAGLVGARATFQALSTVGSGVLVGSTGLEVVVGP